MSWELFSSAGVDPRSFRQSRLPLIVRPKLLSPELKGAGHMQRVERADAQGGAVPLGQINARLPGLMGEIDRDPNSFLRIPFKIAPSRLRLSKREPRQKHLLIDRIGKFHAIERCEEDSGSISQPLVDAQRMRIGNVTRNQKARVDINVQYRLFSRSSSKSATGVSTRSPKIARLRASKSGHSTACGLGDSGTILATTRLRLRSSTTSPASSHLMSWRVSRS